MAKITPVAKKITGRIGEQVGVKTRRVPTQPTFTKTQTVGEAQEEYVRKETAKVDAEIKNYENDIAQLVKKQEALQGGNRAEWNALDNDIAFARRQIRALNQGKQYIRQGAGFADVTSYAVSKAQAELANIQAQQQAAQAAGFSSVQEYKAAALKGGKLQQVIDPATGDVLELYDPTTKSAYHPTTGKLLYGGGVSKITPEKIPLSPEFVKEVKIREELAKDILSRPTDQIAPSYFVGPSQLRTTEYGKPSWEVQPAPTTREKYKRSIGESGYFKGTLEFIGGEVSSLVWRGQEIGARKYGGRYDPQLAELTGQAVGIAPYFTPAGPVLLAGAGTEEIITPSGRERIVSQSEYYKSMGWSPSLARTIAIGTPVVEAGLGYFGIKTQIGGLRAAKEIARAETTFVATEIPKTSKAITDLKIPRTSEVKVLAETKIGKDIIAGVSRQDIFKAKDLYLGVSKGVSIPKGRIGVKGGRFGIITKEGREILPTVGTSIGQEVGTARRLVTGKKGEIPLYDIAGEGILARAKGISYTKEGAIEFDKTIVGGFKKFKGTDFFLFRGGEAKKLRIYPEKLTYRTPQTIKGILYKTKVQKPSQITGVKIEAPITPTEKTVKLKVLKERKIVQESVLGQVSTLSEAAKTQKLLSVKQIPSTLKGTVSTVLQKPIVSKKLGQPTKQISIQTKPTISIEKDKSLTRVISRTSDKTRIEQVTVPVTVSKSITETRQRFIPRTVSDQLKTTSTIKTTVPVLSFVTPEYKPQKKLPKALPLLTFPQLELSPITKPQQGYIPQAKTKDGKWVTLSKQPMSREAALSRASRAIDNTTSSQFRVKKSKGKVTDGIDNYFGVTQQKYRPYRITKGKKKELYNQFIEKKTGGYRLDTQGEKSGLQLAKYAKQQGWLSPVKKKKKTKKKGAQKKSPWLV